MTGFHASKSSISRRLVFVSCHKSFRFEPQASLLARTIEGYLKMSNERLHSQFLLDAVVTLSNGRFNRSYSRNIFRSVSQETPPCLFTLAHIYNEICDWLANYYATFHWLAIFIKQPARKAVKRWPSNPSWHHEKNSKFIHCLCCQVDVT